MGTHSLNERQIRPLTKLLDEPDKLRSAHDAALAVANASDVPVSHRHIAAEVKKCLPPAPDKDTLPKPDPTTNPNPTTTEGWTHDLYMAAGYWVDTLIANPSAPQTLRQAVEQVRTLAWNHHLEQAHAHEHDQLLHTTT